MRQNVRILIVGDDKVGKSSLVTTLINERFSASVFIISLNILIDLYSKLQHVIPEVTIPSSTFTFNKNDHNTACFDDESIF